MTEFEILKLREEVVAEARSWIGTSYVRQRREKKIGCDCASFLAEVYKACGVFDAGELGWLPDDWFHHTDEDKYRFQVARHCAERASAGLARNSKPEPGDLVLFKLGLVYSHGGIVTLWPMIVHAMSPCVLEENVMTHALLASKERIFFNPFAETE